MALKTFMGLLLAVSAGFAETVKLAIGDGAARVRLRDPQGGWKPVPLPGAVAAHPRFADLGVIAAGDVTMEVPAGASLEIDRGTEFVPQSVSAKSGTHRVALERWVDMAARGWWSADLHVHRAPPEMPLLVEASGLNFAPTITRWNTNSNLDAWPSEPMMKVRESRFYSVDNAEDERAWGAALFLSMKTPMPLFAFKTVWPPPTETWGEARKRGAYIDQEKIIWWAAPVITALMTPDSIGVANNHFLEEGMLNNEAWGRPRDMAKYPGMRGFAEYIFDLYYTYLSAGLRVPASAGSANGVLRNPLGYSRSYVHLGKTFSPAAWMEGQKSGRNFVTNGPMLFLTVGGKMPGSVLAAGTKNARVEVVAMSRGELETAEILVNGKIVHSLAPSGRGALKGAVTLTLSDGDWIAARCFEKNAHTIRFAHTSPVYVSPKARRDPEALARLREWIDAYAEQLRATPAELLTESQRAEWLGLCTQAKEKFRP